MRLLILVSAATLCVVAASNRNPLAKTAHGTLEGTLTTDSEIRVFRGIPFAQPPVGQLRWKAPRSPPNWSGVRQAAKFGPRCMQHALFGDMNFRSDGMSEDCLYLNVWTPAKAAREKLPVLVYFFGGGFMAGDGSEPRYDGESMARKGIVAVTVSYRLGVYGFPTARPSMMSPVSGAVPHAIRLQRVPRRVRRRTLPRMSIRRVAQPSLDEYRALYRLAGEPWLWFSRLRMSDADLAAAIHHPAVDVFFLEQAGQPQELLELDRREFPEIELAYFGLAPSLIGQGAGRYLMAHAIAEAWRRQPSRFWVHTCTLDHPRAVEFYLKSGFQAYQRRVEIADDPRLAGQAALAALPSHPVIR